MIGDNVAASSSTRPNPLGSLDASLLSDGDDGLLIAAWDSLLAFAPAFGQPVSLVALDQHGDFSS